MKTRRHIFGGLLMAAAALLCLAGCKKDDEGEKITLGVDFEQTAGMQKTYIGNSDKTIYWSTDDNVQVNGTNYLVHDGVVEVALSDDGYAAVYPATEGNTLTYSGGTSGRYCTGGTVVIPATQNYVKDANGVQRLDAPMAARLDTKTGRLLFRNLYAVIKVTVKAKNASFTLNSITVESTNSMNLAGTQPFTFSAATNTAEALTLGTLSNGSTSVTLTGISTDISKGDSASFYLYTVPFSKADLTIWINGNKTDKTAHARNGIGISRSQLRSTTVELEIPIFSVAADRSVIFSPGNLQYQASTNTWRFAEHQWDYVGNETFGTVHAGSVKCDNASISSTYTGWIDLFGWGTSGWNNGNKYFQPYDYDTLTGTTVFNRERGYGYGPTKGSTYTFDLTETYANADWGVFNRIGSDSAGTWRTLTDAEWIYLLGVDGTGRSSGHPDWWIFNMVKITDGIAQGVKGTIIYPDGITGKPAGISANLTQVLTTNNLTIIDITEDDFVKLEAAGCVFLPAAGYRKGTTIINAGSFGTYWSSTHYGSAAARNCYFDYYKGKVYPNNNNPRYEGRSIRLVKDVK